MKENISETALYILSGISLSISIADNSSTKSSSFFIGTSLSWAIFIMLFANSPFPLAITFGAWSISIS